MKATVPYELKPLLYFSNARKAFVDDLPRNRSAKLLEVGCGSGSTGAYALAQEKCGWCCGVELCQKPAAEAAAILNQVLRGDIEEMALDFPPEFFDILLLSEVLEHLKNPFAVLKKLRVLLKPGALALAGSPNVAHHSVVRMLLKGQWDYEEQGIMDCTHLKWFTPKTYQELFESAGYSVDHVGPAQPLSWKGRMASFLTFRQFDYLLHPQIYLKAHVPHGV